MEPLGLVGSTDRLIAEAEAAVAGAPSIDPTTGQPALEAVNVNGTWAVLTAPCVEVLCGVVLPAWEIRKEDEQPAISEALAECMEQLFPGGVDGKYACWVRLIVTCGAITVGRVAANGGRLPPLFVPKSKKSTSGPTAPAPKPDPMTLTSLTDNPPIQ
jgi:hypothetical protein